MNIFASMRARVASLSIRWQLAAIVALGIIATFAFSSAASVMQQKQMAQGVQESQSRLSGTLLARTLAGPVKFRDADRIAAIYGIAVDTDETIDGVSVHHRSGEVLSSFERPGTVLSNIEAELAGIRQAAQEAGDTIARQTGSHLVVAIPVVDERSDEITGTLTMAWNQQSIAESIFQQTLNKLLVGGLIALLGVYLTSLALAHMVSRPITALRDAMGEVAEDRYDVDIPSQSRNDEIGMMAQRLSQFRDALAREREHRDIYERETTLRQNLYQRLAAGLSELAKGRTDQKIDLSEFSDLDEDHVAVCDNFNAVLANLREMLNTITSTAESVHNSSMEIAEVAMDQSKRSEAQAVTLEESAAAIDNLNVSVQATAQHAADADNQIQENRQQAQAGGDVVAETVEAMRQIEKSSDQITAIIGVIDDIAFQTNLLALNAGVEAARAGEAGRGFAVVASEVRALAQRASESANEIKELILRSGEQVAKGGDLVNRAGAALHDIIDGVNHVSDVVSMIATGSREQANSLMEIRDGVRELDRVTQQNAAVIEESSAASRSLSDEAARMTSALKAFQLSDKTAEVPEEDAWHKDLAEERADRPQEKMPSPAFFTRAGRPQATVNGGDEWEEF